MRFTRIAAAATLLGATAAQVHTDCQPLNRTDCPPDPAFGTSHLFNFNATPSYDLWETTVGSVDYNADTGAGFSVKKQGDSPTIRSKFYIFWGRYEISLKVAPGTGIISSLMLLSDDLDEIDIEFMGANATQVTTNIFAKGDEDDHSFGKEHVMAGGNQDDYHTYIVDWTKERLEWSIDGNVIRTLAYNDAKNGDKYPQTPMRMNIGIWAGGDPSLPKGTIEWAGGKTDYTKGPYTMFVKSIKMEDYTKGAKEYSYGDKTGSYQSIQIKEGNSTAYNNINKPPPKSPVDGWKNLSPTAKIGIYSAIGVVSALALATLLYYYFRQRRLGAAEARLADEKDKAERLELAQFRRDGVDPDSFREHGHEYGEKAANLSPPGTSSGNPFNHPDDSRPGSRNPSMPTLALSAGAAGAAAGGVMAAGHAPSHAAPGTPTSPRGGYNSPNAHAGFDFGVPPSPVRSATADPYRLGSPDPQQAYGMNRMQTPMGQPGQAGYHARQSPGPMQYGQQRTQSPAPGYSGGNQPAYRGQPGGGNHWN
ncbi:Concanavalin A-like lectin/glucanase, subgroup [Cordyceps fumosorosea ARSEF 2679]|uniref:chitinase n=1 Tax=Cordyceps fumosorosea (strain ARSEF 2679) TaxID=1081104 RepID=A0A168BNB2_CORFA|nr:Concanavalin A-like lectin/glucanase, subgroup [Cordyceps fumosorosea ARSEF 2679]OAA70336.1 Concanavalin A-like lectin/glucanase, subgroup [Cordyceps fumosorosea ARSEF 2679]